MRSKVCSDIGGMDVIGSANVWVDVGAHNYFWFLRGLSDIDSVKESHVHIIVSSFCEWMVDQCQGEIKLCLTFSSLYIFAGMIFAS